MPNLKSAPRKDTREWTSLEQKAHLQSRQGGYAIARDRRALQAWFGVELAEFFAIFPTLPVTVGEGITHGPAWSIQDKRLMEEKVSS
jgi:hypothetical protein